MKNFILLYLLFQMTSTWGIEVIRENNIKYCKGSSRLLLDIAYPKDTEFKKPGIVYMHGGFFLAGSKEMFSEEIEIAAERGYVAITINYRLSAVWRKYQNLFPKAVNDSKCAIRWLRAHADKYGVDPERIGAIGFSAGGNLALMAATSYGKYSGKGGWPEYSDHVQAVVNYSGPVNFRRGLKVAKWYAGITVLRYTGKTIRQDRKLGRRGPYRLASPDTYIKSDRNIPPILSVYGDLDEITGPISGKHLDEAMIKAGKDHEFHVWKGANHGFPIVAGNPFLGIARDEALLFMTKHLWDK
jgi:acetyl esterase/lipase